MLDPLLIRRIIGGLILGFVVLLISGKVQYSQAHLAVTSVVGGLSGFLTGLAGIGGPPVVLYEMSGENAAADNRANLIVFFRLHPVCRPGVLLGRGILTVGVFHLFAIFCPRLCAGLASGGSSVSNGWMNRYFVGLCTGCCWSWGDWRWWLKGRLKGR